jgi:hypothetical protein
MVSRKFFFCAWTLLCAAISTAQVFQEYGTISNTNLVLNPHGSGFFDYNGDGWDDIFVVENSTSSRKRLNYLPHALLKNSGIPSYDFTNVTYQAGVQGYLSGIDSMGVSAQGFAAGDFNNDGYMDFCIGMGSRNNHAAIYLNNKNGTFSDYSERGAFSDQATFRGRCAAFLDYDNDGWLDILFLRDSSKPYESMFALYQNNRSTKDPRFISATSTAGLTIPPTVNDLYNLFGFAAADFDNDFDIDIYVPRYSGASLFLRNDNGVFHENASPAGLPSEQGFIGAAAFDYNNDGWFDLFIKRQSGTPLLYANDGDGTFTDVSVESGLSQFPTGTIDLGESAFGGGLTPGDYDNDGNTDMFLINKAGTLNRLFRNRGDGTFTDVAPSAGLTEAADWYWSSPVADYNHDGYLDIYMARCPGSPNQPPYAALYRNRGGSNNWLQLKLTGVQSNKSAVGARIKARIDEKIQTRQVQGGDGWKVNSFWNHFGLGRAGQVDSLVIYWPSGIVQRATEIPAGTFLEMTEKDTTQYYGPPYIAGTVGHFKSGVPVPGVQMSLSGDVTMSAVTGANGRYRLKPVPKGSVNLTVTPTKTRGEDVGYGGVTAFDAALTLEFVSGLKTLNDTQKTAADADGDGGISALDAAFIARYAVGIRDNAPSLAGSWRFVPDSRTYTDIIKEIEQEDFQCRILGDVTENWGSPDVPEKVSGQEFLSCPGILRQSPEFLDVPLSLDGRTPMLAADVWMRFDFASLEFLEAVPSGTASGFSVITNMESPGFLKIALYGAHPAAAGGEVLRVRFRVLEGTSNPTVIQWEKIAVNEHGFRMEATPVTMTGELSGAMPACFGIRGNYPNPFNPGTTVVYSVGSGSETRLVLFDTRGRQVRLLFQGPQNPGEYRIAWNGLDASGSDAPPGLYFCRLTCGSRNQVIKLVKVK